MDDLNFEPANHAQWLQYIVRKNKDPSYTHAMIRALFERAIESVPPVENVEIWCSHYIELWMFYIMFEEDESRDLEVRELYSRILNLIPHERFSFEYVWISAAKFEINRFNDFRKAVSILESAMEKAATTGIFNSYVELKIELEEGEEPDFDKCRRFLGNLDQRDHMSWITYIKFQLHFCTSDRVRSTFDIVLNQPQFYNCHDLWRYYVNFELAAGEFDRSRNFFEELLVHRKEHRIIWWYYAKFVATIAESLFEKEKLEDDVQKRKGKKVEYYELYVELLRCIFRRGIRHFRKSENRNYEFSLIRSRNDFEENFKRLGMIAGSATDEQMSSTQRKNKNRGTITLDSN